MLLNLHEVGDPMKLVYQLSVELERNSEQVRLTQELTLDKSRPTMGLKGSHGLFGSQEWWKNIEERKIPLMDVSGIVQKVYVTGQDESATNNTVDLLLTDGSIRAESIYTNNEEDAKLFRVGSKVNVVYALDELKRQPASDGGINYLEIPLEMAVSLVPLR